MAEYSVKRPLNRAPVHPGEILREDILPSIGLSVNEAARRLGVSRQQYFFTLLRFSLTDPIIG